jgi:hypothetical protein
MKVAFSQVYIHEDARLPLSVHFQRLITKLVSDAVLPSEAFCQSYGCDFNVVFNVSAKRKHNIELRGPSVSRKYKAVEYTIFLPHSAIIKARDPFRLTVRTLLHHARDILKSLQFETSKLDREIDVIESEILNAPQMLKDDLRWI